MFSYSRRNSTKGNSWVKRECYSPHYSSSWGIGKMRTSKLVGDSIRMFLGTVLSVLIGIITTPIVTRIIKPYDYGQLSFFNLYSNIIFTTVLMGLDNSYVRYYYTYTSEKYKHRLTIRVIALPILISLFVSALICLLSKYSKSYSLKFAILLSCNIIILLLHRIALLTVRLELDTKLYSLIAVIQRIIYLLFIFIGVRLLPLDTLTILFMAVIISELVVCGLAIYKEKRIWKKNGKYTTEDKLINKLHIYRYGIPLIFSAVAGWFFSAADRLSIKRYGTYEDVGIYASALNIMSLFSLVQSTFNALWVPVCMKHYEEHPDEKDIYIKANNIVSLIMFSAGLVLILFKDIFALFLGESYRYAAVIIPILSFEPIMMTISETVVYGINFKGKTYYHVIITMICCVVNIMGNQFLVPRFGGQGAAISTAFSYVLFFVLRMYFANKCYPVKFQYKKTIVMVLLIALYALVNMFIDIDLLLNVIIFGIVMTVALIIYKDSVKLILKMVIRSY